jgi:hypothetical protein
VSASRQCRWTERKQFFFEKKNQKTLIHNALGLTRGVRGMSKSFCFFFQKEVLSCSRSVLVIHKEQP